MKSLSEAFPSKYLKAIDLENQEAIATIGKVVTEVLENDGKKEEKAVVYFEGFDKGLVLNKTNGLSIAEIAGSEVFETWPGACICLFTMPVQFGSKLVEAIRVKRPPAPATAQDAPPTVAPATQQAAAEPSAGPVEDRVMHLGGAPQPVEASADPVPFGPADSLNAG